MFWLFFASTSNTEAASPVAEADLRFRRSSFLLPPSSLIFSLFFLFSTLFSSSFPFTSNAGGSSPPGSAPGRHERYSLLRPGVDKHPLWIIGVISLSIPKQVFSSLRLILKPITSNISMPIRKSKCKLIIKLTA